MLTIKGSCCCGGVRFELFEPPAMLGVCHCSRCRKAGSQAYVYVRAEAFRWLAGRDLLTRYRPKPPHRFTRTFCKRCGASLGDPESGRILAIAANCLDDDPGIPTTFHEYEPDRAPWEDHHPIAHPRESGDPS